MHFDPKQKDVKNGKAQDVAAFMKELFDASETKILQHQAVCKSIAEKFGWGWVSVISGKNWKLHPTVRRKFLELMPDSVVVWSVSLNSWRSRWPTDKPGRRQA